MKEITEVYFWIGIPDPWLSGSFINYSGGWMSGNLESVKIQLVDLKKEKDVTCQNAVIIKETRVTKYEVVG